MTRAEALAGLAAIERALGRVVEACDEFGAQPLLVSESVGDACRALHQARLDLDLYARRQRRRVESFDAAPAQVAS